MAREMRFGEEAGRDIIRTVREVGRRMQNQPGLRARNRGTQQNRARTPRIRFQILSCSFSIGLGVQGCDHVTAIVTHVSCGGAGVSVGDEVDVYDPEYCHFNLPVELLVGLSGTATYMDASNYLAGQEYIVDCVPDVQALGCIWMIDTLCCAEEETLYPPE
jgi:hypothetical protein